MKRINNLWDSIISWDNLVLAHKQARKGKSHYAEVKMVDEDPEKYLKNIQESLINRTFTTSEYSIEERFDGRKNRVIYKLPYYPDRIIQHALLNIVGPILVKSFIRDTFQSIRGRGTSDALKRVKNLVQKPEHPAYVLKLDVSKYYPSINNNILKQVLRTKLKCKNTLWLLDDIINSTNGLPIGNYTSQHLGNLYLSKFDWWVKQELKPLGYFRYCDDLLLFADSTEELLEYKYKIITYLNDLKLQIKPNWTIHNVSTQGVDFVGYIIFPTHIRLRSRIAKKFKNTCKKLKRVHKVSYYDINKVMAYKGWINLSSGSKLWTKYATIQLRKKLLRGRYDSNIR